MKVIHKKISLEQFRSRIPTMIDCFNDNGQYIELDVNSTNKDKIISCYPMGNYGMMPCDIVIDGINIPSNFNKGLLKSVYEYQNVRTFKPIGECTNCGYKGVLYKKHDNFYCPCCNKKMKVNVIHSITYGILKMLYHFFKKYNSFLRDGDDCTKVISSATMYWEAFDRNEETEEEYREMDRLFNKEYGGLITVNNNKITIGGMDDIVMNDYFKTILIPQDYQNYWKTDKLYYIDALYWANWFNARYPLYSGKTIDYCFTEDTEECDCNGKITITKVVDCEDCTEYFNRGGDEMYNILKPLLTNSYTIATSPETTSIDLRILFTNSIEDMGEYTIFSNEWQGGVDYKPTVTCSPRTDIGVCENETANGGTTVIYNDDVYVKNCEGESYIYNPCNTFDFSSGWTKYIDVHSGDTIFKVPSDYKYAYDQNDIVHFTTAITSDFINEMALKIELQQPSDLGFYVINDTIYPIRKIEYLEHNGVYLAVKIANGRKYVRYKEKVFMGQKNGNTAIFNLEKIPLINQGKDEISQTDGEFILYQGEYIPTSGLSDYNKYDFYFTYEYTNYYLISGNTNVYDGFNNMINTFGSYITNVSNENTEGYNFNEKTFNIYKSFFVYDFNQISGITSSKLDLLKTPNKCVDDLGYELNGLYTITEGMNTYFAQPKENTLLDIFYKVGNVSQIDELDETNYWGNILTEIEIWKETQGVSATTPYSCSTSSFTEIMAKDDFNKDLGSNERIRCKFTYYIGATLTKDGNAYVLIDNKCKEGVEYTDLCTLIKKSDTYRITNDLSYNVYYYDIQHDTIISNYDENQVEMPKSTFKLYICGDSQTNAITKDITYSPIFRQEYKLGSSSLQKVSENIYIERPIIKPMEKNFQLIDVMTLDALENYGNGKIKILKN